MSQQIKILLVEANVRYWEDSTVNGVEDKLGTLIPCREGDEWKPVIDLETGTILNWVPGTEAKIHYKVCDAGQYWLADVDRTKIKKWSGDYVPNRFLCFGDNGYGDYVILNVMRDGKIDGWVQPDIVDDEWVNVE